MLLAVAFVFVHSNLILMRRRVASANSQIAGDLFFGNATSSAYVHYVAIHISTTIVALMTSNKQQTI